MALLVFLGFVAWAALEVWAAVEVAGWIGVLPMLALLLLSSVAGANVLRRGTPLAWRRIAEASQTGERLGRHVLDGGLIVIAGVLLLLPGLISGVLGLLLLLPPIRAVVRPGLAFLVLRRVTLPVVLGTRGAGWAAGQAQTRRPGTRRGDDIEGTATEHREDDLEGTATEHRDDLLEGTASEHHDDDIEGTAREPGSDVPPERDDRNP